MADRSYSPQDALADVQGESLEDWMNSWWDLLCAALNHYQETLDPADEMEVHTLEAIRRVRMQIVVANRLSDVIHNQDQPIQLPALPGIYEAGQAELHEHLPDVAARG